MVEKRTVAVSVDTFRSGLIPAAAVLCTLAALLGIGAVLTLFIPGSIWALTQDLALSGINDPSALQTWKLIHLAVTVVSAACPAILAICLIQALRKDIGRGLDLLHDAAQWLLRAVNVSGVLALIVLILRVLMYVVSALSINEGLYYLYAMVVSEGLMVVQAWFLFMQLRKFLNCVSDSALSMACTLTTGKLDNVTIPSFAATGFLVLAAFCLVIGADRLFTLTVVDGYISDYYRLLSASDPILVLSGLSLLLSAVTDILLFFYLRRYKRISERLLFRPLRETTE